MILPIILVLQGYGALTICHQEWEDQKRPICRFSSARSIPQKHRDRCAERNSLPKFREGEKEVFFPKGGGTMLWIFERISRSKIHLQENN